MAERSIAFIGSKSGGLLLLQRLLSRLGEKHIRVIICPNDFEDTRSVNSEFVKLAEAYKIPIFFIKGSKKCDEILQKYVIETAFVHGWYYLLNTEIEVDFFGFHYSFLPKYRGNAPLVWQIINGEKEVGISFFKFNSGMDEGELVSQCYVPIAEDEFVGSVLKKVENKMLVLLDKHLEEVVNGSVKLTPQMDVSPSYCGKRRPADGEIFWQMPAGKVFNLIRAQAPPYNGAYGITEDGAKVTFLSARLDRREIFGVPGSVVEISSMGVSVACGDGGIILQTVADEEGNIHRSHELIRSLSVRFVNHLQ